MIDSHSRHDAPMATLFLSFFVPIQCYPCLNCQSHLSVLSTLSFFKLHYHQDSLPLGSLHLLNSENHHYIITPHWSLCQMLFVLMMTLSNHPFTCLS
jgi:hypothetical protein